MSKPNNDVIQKLIESGDEILLFTKQCTLGLRGKIVDRDTDTITMQFTSANFKYTEYIFFDSIDRIELREVT